MKTNQYILIIALFCLGIVSCRTRTEELYSKGENLVEEKKYSEAIEIYNNILKRNSKLQDAYYYKADCYFLDSNYTKALHYYKLLLKKKGVEIEENMISERNVNILESQEVRNHEIPVAEIFYRLGITYYYMDSLSSSFKFLQRSIERKHQIAGSLIWQGLIWTRTESVHKSCDFFQRAKELGDAEGERFLKLFCESKAPK
ncbi:MAG: tetratricopeptide repeat protein [Chitinophagaceae bacterium]|nr:tetratricopeptide repeat protein [Chitinophagaceae bacterium]